MYLFVSLVFSTVVVAWKRLFCLLCGDVLICICSRSVSRILSVSALAWPFVVGKIRKVCPAEFN